MHPVCLSVIKELLKNSTWKNHIGQKINEE